MRSAFTVAAVLACACAVVAGWPAGAFAQVPGGTRPYEAPMASAAPVIDGDLSDVAWRDAPWTESFVDIRGEDWPAPQWATRAKLAWNECCLYVAAELEEPHLWATLTERDAIIYRDHDFEVFLDPDGDGLAYYELEINALGTEFDLFLDKPYRSGGSAHIEWDMEGLRSAVRLDGTLNDPSDEDRGWTVEIAIPWSALRPPDGVEAEDVNETLPARSSAAGEAGEENAAAAAPGAAPALPDAGNGEPGMAPNPGHEWRVNFSRVQWPLLIVDGEYRRAREPVDWSDHPEDNWVWSPQGEIDMHIPERWGVVRFVTGVRMNRRDFVQATGGVLALAPLLGCASGADEDSSFSVWSWVHGNRDRDEGEWRRQFARLRESGVSAVLVGGGDIDLVSGAARAEGLEYHRWFWTMNRNGDAWARENHPEWFTVSRNLQSSLEYPPYVEYYRWVCPSREPVRAYLRGLVDGLAANPAIDGVHLDYVRHCDVILPRGLWETYDLVQDVEHPEFDFCYCDVCREQFAAVDGRDPLEIPDPPADEAWRRFRWDSVRAAVRELAEAVHQHGKPISAAVFPTPTIARTLVRQAWDEWPLDRFFPMLYQGFYLEDIEWIGDGVREGVAAVGGHDGTPLCAGLYLPSLDPQQLAEAVATAREAGAEGVSLFEMDGLSEEHLAALRAALV